MATDFSNILFFFAISMSVVETAIKFINCNFVKIFIKNNYNSGQLLKFHG